MHQTTQQTAQKKIYLFICFPEPKQQNNISPVSLAGNLFGDTYSTNCCQVTDEPAEWWCVNGARMSVVCGVCILVRENPSDQQAIFEWIGM